MNTSNDIREFLAQKHIAVAGYSRDPKKFGHLVFKTLVEKGYEAYPVNPAGGTTPRGNAIYENIDSLPDSVTALVVVTPRNHSEVIVRKGLEKGLKSFWLQQMSDSPQALSLLNNDELNVISGKCILMHANPGGIHKFHRWLAGLFGRLPQ